MKKKHALLVAAVVVVVVMVSFPRFTIASPSTPSRILVVQLFSFEYQGNGISTTVSVTPGKLASANYSSYVPFPNLTLNGLAESGNSCHDSSGSNFPATFSFQSGRVTVNFTTAPVNGDVGSCYVQLVYAPA